MPGALIVMAKRPAAGAVKTRLAAAIGLEAAAALYESFLRDAVDLARAIPGVDLFIAYPAADDSAYFADLAPGFGLLPQRGDSLAERLEHVLHAALAAGNAPVIAIDSDSPTLPPAYIAQAFDLLASPAHNVDDDAYVDVDVSVVLGPCADGGFYLIGMRRPQPGLLAGVRMSTRFAQADTLAAASTCRLHVELLPEWYDVDVPQDLKRLRADLIADPQVASHSRRHFDQA